MKANQLSKSRRALLLAKRLRAKHGLPLDLTIPCFELEPPADYDGPPWEELVHQLARYEVVVWRTIALTLRRFSGERGIHGNNSFGPRRH